MAKLIGAGPGDITRKDVLKTRGNAVVMEKSGQAIVTKWPRRRGPPISPRQRAWVLRFKCLARGLKSPDPLTLDAANHWAKEIRVISADPIQGSGWYYRDVLFRSTIGKLIMFQGEKRLTTPTVSVYGTNNVALTSGVVKVLTPEGYDWDNNVFWNSGLNPTRLTVRAPGLYLCIGTVEFTNVTGNARAVLMRVNGSPTRIETRLTAGNANTQRVPCLGLYYFHANDYVELCGYSNQAGVSAHIYEFQLVAITPEAILL